MFKAVRATLTVLPNILTLHSGLDFIVGELPSSIESNLAALVALGVEVAITELDISELNPFFLDPM